MRFKHLHKFILAGIFLMACMAGPEKSKAYYFDFPLFLLGEDTTTKKGDTLKFPIEDRQQIEQNKENGKQFDLKDPSNLDKRVIYDPETNTYIVEEKIGDTYFRTPMVLNYDEYLEYQSTKDEKAYWRKRANTLLNITKSGGVIPKVELGNAIFDRIFGGTTIEVKPQGNVDIFFGGNWQNVQNPALVQSAQKYGIFDFDIQMNINLLAKIGEKMKLNFNYNSKATFDFENQLKLEYTGQEDDIIKKIEAGYISFPLRSSLIQGVQNLFGIKTQLQFGRLMMTNVFSQQKSQKESFQIKSGAQTQEFNIASDEYDYFRHFLLAQYFRDNYNAALKEYPVIQSLNNITRIEVWITNRQGITTNARDIVALQDLGEPDPYNTKFKTNPTALPDNAANSLYGQLVQNPSNREIGNVVNAVQTIGLKGTADFEKTFARKLNPNEYYFNPQLGFISINAQLQPDDVIGVAFEYTHNGQVHQVGEFSQNLPPDSSSPKVLFLKMLKSTTPDPTKPIWDLMMKNVYSLGGSGISKDKFLLNIYYSDPGGGEKRYLPEGPNAGIPLLSLLNLDKLNFNNDPQPDGRFDFVEGWTIQSQTGKIIFPVLEPFGEDLKPSLGNDPALEKKYLYNILYDSTKNIAIQFPQYNRFLIKGTYQGSNSSEIFLGGFNIPQGSVVVSAGGQRLIEGVDYTIDYGIGKLKIENPGILSSGVPINVSYENNIAFGTQIQNLMGTRLDYFINKDFTIGSTILRLSERPYFNKVTFGDDPIKNTVVGLDANYQKEMPGLTTAINNLPIIETEAPSMLTASGEVARLFPGHSKQISGTSGSGEVYIDDFEGTRSAYDLKFPLSLWSISSTPQEALDKQGNVLFPEATLVNNPDYGKNRARIMWYNIDPCLADIRQRDCFPNYANDTGTVSNHYVRLIQPQEVFPNRSFTSLQGNLSTFDITYFPDEKGPYNLDAKDIDANGNLMFPDRRWGGIMRPIDFSDFETANVEFIEFWIMDPFINNPGSNGGQLYLNLGNISEDILKDSRKFFENGLPAPDDPKKVQTTTWSRIPQFQQQITTAFDNDPAARPLQDVGYDGMNDSLEKEHLSDYLQELETNFGIGSKAYQDALTDPNNDNYHHFRGEDYDQQMLEPLERYKRFNNPQGNSPLTNNNQTFSSSFTNIPESEDINRDNTLNENEQYFQYRLDLKPNMQVGESFIVNKQITNVTLANKKTEPVTWYQFKIPIRKYTNSVGGISDFRSIRFVRLFLTGFQDSVTLRFARMELGRNQWRRYNFSLKEPGELIPLNDNDITQFNLSSVSLEENGGRTPIPYVIPPGINRQNQAVSNGQNVLLNEQALALQVCDLEDGDARGVFKSLGMDMRQFKRIDAFIHAEAFQNEPVKDGDLEAVLRLGTDFVSNYYEYRIPLKLSLPTARTDVQVWPVENNLNLEFEKLINAKRERNRSGHSKTIPYITQDDRGNYITVVGNPNIGDAKTCMLGVLNPKKTPNTPLDDGGNKCIEVWFNELRLANLSEQGGWAAIGQSNIQLADIANVKLSGNMYTQGYGNVDQRVNERARENFSQFNVSTSINAGKLAPKEWGVQLPVYAGYSQSVTNPVYDPYDLDVKFKDKLSDLDIASKRDSLKKAAQTFNSIKSLNFQNVRIAPTGNKKVQPWDLQNFDASYAYTQNYSRNPLLSKDVLDEHQLDLGYTYSVKSKPIEPFKKLISQKKKYLRFVREFNFNVLPANFTFRTGLNRILGETQVRNIDEGNYQLPVNYFKSFNWTRNYTLRWNLTRSLSLDYSALNNSRVDEPEGRINTPEKKDTLWRNFSRFGRTTHYNQSLNANYNLPLNMFPVLDWMNIRAGYGATYNYDRASLLATHLGNDLGNTQNIQLNGDFNFTQLYNKSKLLRVLNTPQSEVEKQRAKKAKEKSKEQKDKGNKEPDNASSLPGKNRKPGDTPFAKNRRKPDRTEKDNTEGTSENKDSQKETAQDEKEKNKKEVISNNDKVRIVQGGDPNAVDSVQLRREALELAKKKQKEEEERKKLEEKKKKLFEKKKRKEERKNRQPNPPEALRIAGRTLMSLKRVSVNYNETMGTFLPGYMDSTQYLGMNFGNQMRPGWDFAFGYQPDKIWMQNAGQRGWLTRDSLFAKQFTQNYAQNLNIQANLEPFRDFRVDLSWKKMFSKNLSELFKDTIGGTDEYVHLNPYETGSFEISFISLKTLFQRKDDNNLTDAFYRFENNREIISRRLGYINPYTGGLAAPEDKEYSKGYTRYAQEVIIPAFLSAYSGKDPEAYPLINNQNETTRSNPFRYLKPKPNWRVNYNGLAKNKKLRTIFQNVTLSHAYTSSLSMNGFNSSLMYQDVFGLGYPSFIDSITGNYIPYFVVPNITINENFGPIAGIDATFTNSLNLHFEYRKSRTLSMSLIDFQLSETGTTEFSLGAGLRIKDVVIPIQYFNLHNQKSDMNIKFDFTLRDDLTTISRLDQRISQDTRGQRVIGISPSIDYLLNKSVTIRFLYDRRQSIPYVSNAFPITSTRGGIMVRFLLGE